MTAWLRDGVVYGFDLESTGVDPKTARIVTACVVVKRPGEQPSSTSWVLNPGVDVPDGAAAIHGYTTQRCADEGRPPAEALLEIATALEGAWKAGWPVVGHNIGGYDLTLLDHELQRHCQAGIADFGGPGMVIDTLVLDLLLRPEVRGKGTHTLTACVNAWQVEQGTAHDAHGDVLSSLRVLWRMAGQNPARFGDLHALQQIQERGRRNWADGLGAFLQSVGKADDVVREWPYQPAPPAVDAAFVCRRGA